MTKTRQQRRAFAAVALAALLAGGCSDFGVGGTGETVLSAQRLREIEATSLEQMPREVDAATRPSDETGNETGAATLPAVGPVKLGLDEVRAAALANNLDIRVQLYQPTASKQGVTEAQAQFEAVFTTRADYVRTDAPTASQLNSAQFESFGVTPGIDVPLQTGGTIRVQAPMSRDENDNQFSTLNPAYETDLALSLSQPLLRGAGTDSNAFRIRVAFYRDQQVQARTKLEIIRVLANADRAYWRLYAARQDLLVRKQEYDLAVQLLEQTRRLAAAGTISEVEVVRSESGVADRVEAVIRAENAVRDRQRDIKRIMNRDDLPLRGDNPLEIATDPKLLFIKLDSQKLVQTAIAQRMELVETELQILSDTAAVAFARNDRLPLLALEYTYNINGLGESFDKSFEMTRDNDFADHRAGLNLSVPIGNEAAKSRLRRAMIDRLSSLATKELRIATITQELLTAVDQLNTEYQRIVAAGTRVQLAARVVDAELRQFEQGLRTATDVLDARTRLALAKLSEISAIADYQIAQVDIAFATGTVLGASNIEYTPAPEPKP
jgi:outer membrane protein TolC